jgi:polyisoprenoid-binding protein YceI
MKKSILFYCAIIISASLITSCGDSQETPEEAPAEETATEEVAEAVSQSYNVSPESMLMWKGTMMGMYSHEGTVNITGGQLQTENGQVVGGSFTIDMMSITPTDDNFDPAKGSTKEKLVGHLSSPDFFDVDTYHTATFTITAANGSDVTGTMNIKGVENEETINNVVITEADGAVNITADIVIDRQKYGAAYAMDVKDMVISDDIELQVALSGTAQ